jgi:hypothetical protein
MPQSSRNLQRHSQIRRRPHGRLTALAALPATAQRPAPELLQRRVRRGRPRLRRSEARRPAAARPAVGASCMPSTLNVAALAACMVLRASAQQQCRPGAPATAASPAGLGCPKLTGIHGVLQTLPSRQTVRWARWAQSTSQEMAAWPSVSNLPAFTALDSSDWLVCCHCCLHIVHVFKPCCVSCRRRNSSRPVDARVRDASAASAAHLPAEVTKGLRAVDTGYVACAIQMQGRQITAPFI